MMSEEKKDREETSEGKKERRAVAYGGYRARLSYEKQNKKNPWRVVWTVLGVVACLCLVTLSVFGVIGIARGDFFPQETTTEDVSGTITVPSRLERLARERDVATMLEDLQPSQCVVEVTFTDGLVKRGSGFVISEEGYAVCSASLFRYDGKETEEEEEAKPLPTVKEIHAWVGNSYYSTVTLRGTDESRGIGLLYLQDEMGYVTAPNNVYGLLSRGETVYLVGSSQGQVYHGTVLSGVVASTSFLAKLGDGKELSVIWVDTAPNETVYGGPVMNSAGSVVGFCTDAVACPWGEMTAVLPISSVYAAVNEILS